MQELTAFQQFERGRIYDTVARCMPTEGRDFKVEITFTGTDRMPVVDVIPLTSLARAWSCFCNKILHQTYGGKYAATAATGSAAAGTASVPCKKHVL